MSSNEKIATCIKEHANWGVLEKENKFDHNDFNPEIMRTDLAIGSPKLMKLIQNIKEIDARDMKEHGRMFKHFIYSDIKSAYGAKLIASGLKASGFEHAYGLKKTARGMSFVLEKSAAMKTGSNRFATLTSVAFFGKPIGVNFRRDLLRKFNTRPDNIYGENIRIIILDSGFREGVDLFDIKYVHLFEPIITAADEKQAIGRATRYCGQKGLTFDAERGWPLQVYKYETVVPEDIKRYIVSKIPDLAPADTFFNLFMKYSNIDQRKIAFANELQRVAILGAADHKYTHNIHNIKVGVSGGGADGGANGGVSGGADESKYIWPEVKVENLCIAPPIVPGAAAQGALVQGGPSIVTFTPTQEFVRDTFTPTSPTNGMLLFHSVGTGKTATAIATASSTFEPADYTIIYVTRYTLKVDVWKNMFDQVASIVIQNYLKSGKELPTAHAARLRLISKKWIEPMSYKQFSNMLEGKNQYHDKVAGFNGKTDILRKTLVIIDEAHKLFASDVEGQEKANVETIREAFHKSYAVSGPSGEAVKVLFMTATPYTSDPMDMVRLLNLLRPAERAIPEEFEDFAKEYLDDNGMFTDNGVREFLTNIAGYISYLNRSNDIRSFAYPVFHTVFVPMSDYEFRSAINDYIELELTFKGAQKALDLNKAHARHEATDKRIELQKQLDKYLKDQEKLYEKCMKLNVKDQKEEYKQLVVQFNERKKVCDGILAVCSARAKQDYENLLTDIKTRSVADLKTFKDGLKAAIKSGTTTKADGDKNLEKFKADLKDRMKDEKEQAKADYRFDYEDCRTTKEFIDCNSTALQANKDGLENLKRTGETRIEECKDIKVTAQEYKRMKAETNRREVEEFERRELEKLKVDEERVNVLKEDYGRSGIDVRKRISNDKSQRTSLEKCLKGKLPPAYEAMLRNDASVNMNESDMDSISKTLEQKGAMDNIFLISGHGHENVRSFKSRYVMPDDKSLVIFPVCSRPNFMNIGCKMIDLFMNKAMKGYLRNPIKYRRELNREMGQNIRIFLPGERVPDLGTNLFLNFDKAGGTVLAKSGVFRLNSLPEIDRSVLSAATTIEQQLGSTLCVRASGVIPGIANYNSAIHKEVFKGNVYKPAGRGNSYKALEGRNFKLKDVMEDVGTGIYYYIGCRSSQQQLAEQDYVNILENSEQQQEHDKAVREKRIEELAKNIKVVKEGTVAQKSSSPVIIPELSPPKAVSKSSSSSSSSTVPEVGSTEKKRQEAKEKRRKELKEKREANPPKKLAEEEKGAFEKIAENIQNFGKNILETSRKPVTQSKSKWETMVAEWRKELKELTQSTAVVKTLKAVDVIEHVIKNMSNKTSKDTVLQLSINKERTYYILNEYTRYIINRRKYYYHPVLYGIIPNGLKYRSSKCTSKLLGERIESLYSKGTKIVVPKTLEEWGRNMGLFEELCSSTRII